MQFLNEMFRLGTATVFRLRPPSSRRWHHTIFSLSSGAGKSGVAVIRCSGPQSLPVLRRLARFPTTATLPLPRHAYLRHLHDPRTGEPLDRALCLWFPGPHSFTGEDSCEFQVHGGPAVIAAMLATLGAQPGCRQAAAGEFTKRAFFAGKLDLTAVEGLADLIHAETEHQRRQALRQADGHLGQLYVGWAGRLLRSVAHLEACIDFAEDELIDPQTLQRLLLDVAQLAEELAAHLRDGRRGERLRTGVRAAIVGAPNVGKSSFMNSVCRQEIAIVSAEAGTTRDVVERAFDLGGWPLVLADTAGLRMGEAVGEVEREGIERAKRAVREADLQIVVMEAAGEAGLTGDWDGREAVGAYLRRLGLEDVAGGWDDDDSQVKRVLLVNKADLIGAECLRQLQARNPDVVFVSCLTGNGIEAAVEAISARLKGLCSTLHPESPVISQQRHRQFVTDCLGHLHQFAAHFAGDERHPDLAIGAHQLRCALRSIGQITGEVSTEDVLDVIFRDFCIGK